MTTWRLCRDRWMARPVNEQNVRKKVRTTMTLTTRRGFLQNKDDDDKRVNWIELSIKSCITWQPSGVPESEYDHRRFCDGRIILSTFWDLRLVVEVIRRIGRKMRRRVEGKPHWSVEVAPPSASDHECQRLVPLVKRKMVKSSTWCYVVEQLCHGDNS